jgi:hypothetical protein
MPAAVFPAAVGPARNQHCVNMLESMCTRTRNLKPEKRKWNRE